LKILSKSKGFTLIEILLAIVILSISLLALAALMATTTRNNSFGGHLTEAATYAQDSLERFRTLRPQDIPEGPDNDSVTDPINGITYSRNWNVVTNGNLRTITITISWTDPTSVAAPNSFTLVSAISQQ
jgi:prepilin-type N-terminal cleavage/methylation domain-containing protein